MRSVVASLLFLLSTGASFAENGSTRIIEIIGEKPSEERADAGAAPRVVVGEACGSKQDDWFCGALSPQAGAYASPGLSVSAPRGAMVVVMWSGTVSCELRSAAGRIDFAVDLALADDGPEAAEPAGEGRARIARRFRVDPAAAGSSEPPILDATPVSLTRAFLRKRGGAQVYRVRIDGAFPAGAGACTISGGAMTATVADR